MNIILKLITPKSVIHYFQTIQKRIINLEDKVLKQDYRISNLETSIDYLINSPLYISNSETGFNGQIGRKEIFREMLNLNFDLIIETGTFIGNTTGYMHEKSLLPVYTCELNHRFYLLAKSRLKKLEQIYFYNLDSRSFLKEMAHKNHSKDKIFFYLDAHWYEDLPLRDEITIISENWEEFVIMIDDFQVPEDPGYGFDDFGYGKNLTIEHIYDLIEKFNLTYYYPKLKSENESGSKRGCIILVKDEEFSLKILKMQNLSLGN